MPKWSTPAKSQKSLAQPKSRKVEKSKKSLHPAKKSRPSQKSKSRKVAPPSQKSKSRSLAPFSPVLVSLPISQSSQSDEPVQQCVFRRVRPCAPLNKRSGGRSGEGSPFRGLHSKLDFFPTRHSASQFRNASQTRMLAGKKSFARPATLAGRAKIIYACGEGC